jgi:hypothetical protein
MIFFYLFLKKNKTYRSFIIGSLFMIFFIQIVYAVIVPRAENISQHQYIKYIEKYSAQGVVSTWFKSYATYFYAKTTEPLLKGKQYPEQVIQELGINTFMICRVTDTSSIFREYPDWQFVESNSGYVVLSHLKNNHTLPYSNLQPHEP